MNFEDMAVKAAKAAEKAVSRTVNKYAQGAVYDEDDLTGVLIGNLDAEFSKKIGGLSWTSSILRHRKGKAAQEKEYGADLLVHVRLNTRSHSYSKGVLVQSKRVEWGTLMNQSEHDRLVEQCKTMLNTTPSAFIFNYTQREIRCASATKIMGTSNRSLYDECNWTSYRFFLELFRCPIGDPKLTSGFVADLPKPAANEIVISAESGA